MSTRFLMCPAKYFGVDYVINPWMAGQIGKVQSARARKQWTALYQTLNRLALLEGNLSSVSKIKKDGVGKSPAPRGQPFPATCKTARIDVESLDRLFVSKIKKDGVDESLAPAPRRRRGVVFAEGAPPLRRGVELMAPHPNLPDQVFTANSGLLYKNIFIPSRFRNKQRRLEEPWFRSWFESREFEVVPMAEKTFFEGAGDALLQPGTNLLWMGYGFRTDLEARAFLENRLPLRVLPLRLVDPRFYHLDVCFCPLLNGWALYYPPAFDAESLQLIETHIPPKKRIVLSDKDALGFACNAVLIGKTLVMNQAGPRLKSELEEAGYGVVIVSVQEFVKAGGATKCLTMELSGQETHSGCSQASAWPA